MHSTASKGSGESEAPRNSGPTIEVALGALQASSPRGHHLTLSIDTLRVHQNKLDKAIEHEIKNLRDKAQQFAEANKKTLIKALIPVSAKDIAQSQSGKTHYLKSELEYPDRKHTFGHLLTKIQEAFFTQDNYLTLIVDRFSCIVAVNKLTSNLFDMATFLPLELIGRDFLSLSDTNLSNHRAQREIQGNFYINAAQKAPGRLYSVGYPDNDPDYHVLVIDLNASEGHIRTLDERKTCERIGRAIGPLPPQVRGNLDEKQVKKTYKVQSFAPEFNRYPLFQEIVLNACLSNSITIEHDFFVICDQKLKVFAVHSNKKDQTKADEKIHAPADNANGLVKIEADGKKKEEAAKQEEAKSPFDETNITEKALLCRDISEFIDPNLQRISGGSNLDLTKVTTDGTVYTLRAIMDAFLNPQTQATVAQTTVPSTPSSPKNARPTSARPMAVALKTMPSKKIQRSRFQCQFKANMQKIWHLSVIELAKTSLFPKKYFRLHFSSPRLEQLKRIIDEGKAKAKAAAEAMAAGMANSSKEREDVTVDERLEGRKASMQLSPSNGAAGAAAPLTPVSPAQLAPLSIGQIGPAGLTSPTQTQTGSHTPPTGSHSILVAAAADTTRLGTTAGASRGEIRVVGHGHGATPSLSLPGAAPDTLVTIRDP